MMNQANTSQNSHSAGGHMAFLRRVTEDDQFRAALEADPQAAFAEFGLSVDADQIPSEVRVPSAESIADILVDAEATDPDAPRDQAWMGFIAS